MTLQEWLLITQEKYGGYLDLRILKVNEDGTLLIRLSSSEYGTDSETIFILSGDNCTMQR